MIDLNQVVNLADIITESVVDGTGIRFTIFSQGCPHKCIGCHNPSTHCYEGGLGMSLEQITEIIKKDPLLDGITLSGGEPFLYAKQFASLASWTHENKMNVWCYTGYTLEQLNEIAKKDPGAKALLNEIDVLVDGRFEEDKKDLKLVFKGSENQRIIDLKKMREQNSDEIILFKF